MKLLNFPLAVCVVLTLMACGRVNKDLSSDPEFVQVMGKQYRTRVDLAVYRFQGDKRLEIGPFGRSPLPDQEGIKLSFPMPHDDLIILGILPAGSEFKVIKVKEEGSTGMSFVNYLAKITKSSDPRWVGKVVYSALTTVELIPQFNPAYVEELPPSP